MVLGDLGSLVLTVGLFPFKEGISKIPFTQYSIWIIRVYSV